ncbi:MAG: hypothetical protein IJH07_02135 [Ruminococcus sp.]|nr:hypothetical protein [Ruminococcus sp.]
MRIRRTIALFLAVVMVFTACSVTAFAAEDDTDIRDCEILFDGEGWRVYPIDSTEDTLSLKDLKIALVDPDGEPVPEDAYELVVGTSEWDEELQQDIFTEVEEPFGLPAGDEENPGFAGYAVYAVAKEGSGYSGQTEPREFMLWHRYSFNWFGANADFGEEYKGQCTWSWHDYYAIPADRIKEPVIHGIAYEDVDPQNYEITYFKRGERPDFDDPDYDQKLYPETDPLDGLPTKQGSYFARIDGKEPYYGTSYVDFDIIEESESFVIVRGSDRRYYNGDTIYIPEGGEVDICFDIQPYDGSIPGWRNDALREEGFDISDDPVFFEGDDFAYAHIRTEGLAVGTVGTLYCDWYSFVDIFINGIPWGEAVPVANSYVNIAVGEEPAPETYAYVRGEESVRYSDGDTISIRNGEEILLAFDLTAPVSDLYFECDIKALKTVGFTAEQIEDDGGKYLRISAQDMAPGVKASIPVSWYESGEEGNPLYGATVSLEVAGEPDSRILGDADNDGEVTIIDATLIQRFLAKTPVYVFNENTADVDRNGAVETVDVTLIQRSLSHLPTDALVGDTRCGTYFAAWNVEENLLPEDSALSGPEAWQAQAEIRKALNLFFDYGKLGDVTGIERKAASSFISDGVTDADGTDFYTNDSEYEYGYFDTTDAEGNTAKALAILKQYYAYDEVSGYFTDVPKLTYCCNNGEVHVAIGNLIKDTLAGYGIDVEVKDVDWFSYLDTLASGGFSMARDGWVVEYDDPLEFLTMFTTDSEDNLCGFGSGAHAGARLYDIDLSPYGVRCAVKDGTWAQTYDVLIEAIRTCRHAENRYRMMHLAEDMLMSTGCILPMYYY